MKFKTYSLPLIASCLILIITPFIIQARVFPGLENEFRQMEDQLRQLNGRICGVINDAITKRNAAEQVRVDFQNFQCEIDSALSKGQITQSQHDELSNAINHEMTKNDPHNLWHLVNAYVDEAHRACDEYYNIVCYMLQRLRNFRSDSTNHSQDETSRILREATDIKTRADTALTTWENYVGQFNADRILAEAGEALAELRARLNLYKVSPSPKPTPTKSPTGGSCSNITPSLLPAVQCTNCESSPVPVPTSTLRR